MTGVSCVPLRCRCSSNVGIVSITYKAKVVGREASTLRWSGRALPYFRRVRTAAGRGDAEPRREAHQLRHRAGLHLRHHVRALLLDGGLAGAQLAGDLLVEQTGDDPRQHVSLTRRERRVATTKLGALVTLRAHRAIALDRASNGVEQILLAERLRQKLDRAGFHGPDR